MARFSVHVLSAAVVLAVMAGAGGAARAEDKAVGGSSRRPIIYVMPNAVTNPDGGDNSQVVVDSSHNGKEPQVAKIYQELQRRAECQAFGENMIREKADYFLLLQHGGGKGNRWAVSDKNGDVIASGDSFMLGNSVKAACEAIGKDWQRQTAAKGK